MRWSFSTRVWTALNALGVLFTLDRGFEFGAPFFAAGFVVLVVKDGGR